MTYLVGSRPRLVVNDAKVVAANTLHVIRLNPGTFTPLSLALFWCTSLVRLSAELEGHALGGGMLKLEPGEAQRILIPIPRSNLETVALELDDMLRRGHGAEITTLADTVVLKGGLGLTKGDIARLRSAADELEQNRRIKR
jgi:adenine-specific DNA-methyltransferase